MNKVSSYLSSLILSVLLVFTIIGSSCAILCCINVNGKGTVKIFDDNHLEDDIISELEQQYSQQYNASGIPASVYMGGLDKEYIRKCGHFCIENAFEVLENGGKYSVILLENNTLNESIEKFFNDYADENNFKKDENFEKKVQAEKEGALLTVKSCCDVFKFGTINSKDVLTKASKVYSKRIPLTLSAVAASLVLIVFMLIVNRKKKTAVLYWTGISILISGIVGSSVSIFLLANKYFDSFSIKQPAVFKAYTSMMYKLTESYMAVGISSVIVGICLIVIYALFNGNHKKNNVNPTTF